MQTEEIKEIPGHKGYFVSSYGYIITPKGDIRPSFNRLDRREYYSVFGKIRIHVAVAKCFIPNPENKPFVNHKDRNRKNNNVNNLEWVTPSENTAHYHADNKRAAMKYNVGDKITILKTGEIDEIIHISGWKYFHTSTKILLIHEFK